MIRKAFSRARKALTGITFGAALAFAPAPAHAFWDTKKAWNDLLQFAVKQVNAPGEFEIILGEVTKPEDGFALITTLQIKDSDGIWFDASNLLVDWSPTALLRGRFTFETLSAEQISILRAPIGRGDPPAEEAPPVAFAWPRPPVPISIDALKVDRLRIEGGLLPQDLEARIEGGFSDIGDVQDAKLTVQRTDRPGDRITLESRIDFDDLDIAFALKATEEPGGLVAQMGSLPPDQALELDLEAKGTPDNLPFNLFADIGQIGIAKGEGVASWGELITARFDGTVEPGEETSADWKRALGEAARITVDFAETEKGTYDLKALEVDSKAFELSGQGIVDVGQNEIDMALDWDVKDIDAFNQIIAPAKIADLKGTARAVGSLTAPKVDVNAQVAGLDAAFGKAEAILLKIDSQPIDGARGEASKQQRFDFEASAKGLALADAGIQDALGPTPSFSGKGKFDGIASLITLETLKIDARSVMLDGSAQYDINIGALGAQLSGEARELGPFFRSAGLPIDGRAALAFKLEGLQGGTLDRLFLNAQMADLSSDDADIAAALGEKATLELLLTESGADTIRIERGLLESEILRAEASGTVSIPGDTVDLAVDFKLHDAAAIAALIEPAEIAAAEGKATLSGTLSEPEIGINAMASDFGLAPYAAETARIEGTVKYRKDRRAPFALTTELDGVKTGDEDLDRVVGTAPVVRTRGLYDTATGLLTLDETQIDLADADVALTGDIHLKKQTLDITYDLDAGDLSGFEALAGKPLAGSVDLAGRAKGPFTLPLVTARGDVRDFRYDAYSVEAADLDIEMETDTEGATPFRIDVTATNPKTGDAGLDALIGTNPTLKAEGTLDRNGPAVTLETLDADLATLKAKAQGSVDLGTRLLDLNFDLDASDLSGLDTILGTKIAGAVTAKGTASGSFTAPELDATIDGKGLRYDVYSVGAVAGKIDVEQSPSGFAPFDIDIEARDVSTGDAALDDLLAGASTLRAKGAFNQAEKKIRIESSVIRAAGADASLSGSVDLGAKTVDLDFDVEAENLSPFEPFVGVPLGGSVTTRGTAKGGLPAPQVDVTLSGRKLRYDTYSIGAIDGKIDVQQSDAGFAPFDIDIEARDVSTGDAALDDLLAGASTLRAKGAFNQAKKKIRIESSVIRAAGADASLSGDVDIEAKTVDLDFDIDAENLSPFEPFVGVPLGGSVNAKGTAKGGLPAPQVDVTLSGRKLRYDTYSIGAIDGKIDVQQSDAGFAPFDIDVKATGIETGDPALDDLLDGPATIRATGGFNQSAQRVRIRSATLRAAGTRADLSGDVDLGKQTLDLDFDVEADNLSVFEGIAGVPLNGAITARGTAGGRFSDPALDVALSGKGLRYDAYRVGALDGTLALGQAKGGFAPFDIDMKASGLSLGDPALDDVLAGGVSIDAAGAFDRTAQKLRLDRGKLVTAAARADLGGSVDLKAQRLDLRFDVAAEDLSVLGPLVGTDVAGSAALKGTAKGPFTLPAVNATVAGRGIAYDRYRITTLDGRVSMESGNGPLPFDVDLTASDISTGDPALDAALGARITVDAQGAFDRAGKTLRLDSAALGSDFATAMASGTVDLAAQTLDVAFDLGADRLDAFAPLLKADLGGALAIKDTASGPFVIPAVDLDLTGNAIRYQQYSIRSLTGSVDVRQAVEGALPFDLDLAASGIGTGDPALDAAIGETVRLDATGTFDQDAQFVTLDAARFDAAFAQANAQGAIDLGAQTLDVAFDLTAADLGPVSAISGAAVRGSVALRGTARGPFSLPAVDASVSARDLGFDAYAARALDGSVSLGLPENGFAPFVVDMKGEGLSLGDPALDAAFGALIDIDATGAVDIAEQRIRLDRATLVTDSATVAANGSVDLKAQQIDMAFDVEAGSLAAFGPLANADLGGALSVSGRATGPFVIPRVNADIAGTGLRYQAYGIGSLNASITMDSARDGFMPFTVDLAAAGIMTGDPSLDFALEEGVSLNGRGGFDLENQRLRLDGLNAQARFASLTANGLVELKAKTLDLNFGLDASDLSPLTGFIGKPVGGALRASGNARGGFDAPIVNMTTEGGGLYYDSYSLGGLSLDLKMPGDAPGYLPFTLTGTLTQPRLNNPQIEEMIGETVTLRAEGVFDPTRKLLRLTDTQVRTANAGVSAFGDIDLGNSLIAVDYYVDVFDLSIAQSLAGKTLAGSARSRGRISGALTDPTTVGRLTVQNLVYDTYRVTSITAFYDLQRLGSGPAGSLAVNAQTEFGPLTAKTRFDLTGGSLQVQEISVQGLGLGIDGSLRTGPGGLLDGSLSMTAANLGQIGAFIGQDIAGQINGTVTLNGDQGRQNALFDVAGNSLRYGPQDSPTVRMAVFNAKGQVFDVFGSDPYVDATVGGLDGALSGFAVKRVDVTAKGAFSGLDTTISAAGGALGSDRIETTARLNIVNPPRSATVSRLALVFDGRQASIIEPVVIEEIPPGGFRIRNLDLRAEDGEVRGSLEYTASGVVADLRIRNFPLALASLSGVDVIRSGRLDGTVDVDTRGGVRGTFALDAYSLRLKGAQIDDPFALTAKGTMDGSALNVSAEMTGAQLVQPLTASARIPLIPSAGSPLPMPNRNAPFSAQVDWQGDVSEIWAFVPLPDHILSGPVVINGRAGGTLAAPVLSGGALLSEGRYSNIEFGTLLTNLNAKADFTQDGRAVFEISAKDGVEGTVNASGSYVVASSMLDTRLSLNNAALVRRDDATAILSGEATAVSQGRDIRVDGQFRTNYVEVRLIGNFGSSLTVIDAIPVGKSAPLYIPPVEETAESRKILLNVSLSMPNRVFVRGRGLDSEWGGQLDVRGTAANPRINGEIERRRGVLDLLGKQFELSIGTVRFTGDTSPFVQIRLQRDANDILGWIEVRGDVPDIDIEFGSIPALPEGEVLPRLLFGRSKQSLTALEAAQLAAGVATLLSGKAGVLDSVRDAVGVDVLRVESDVDGGTSIITGKYLRDEVFVGAKQNLQSGETSGLVEVEVFDNFEIEGELGSEEAKGSVGWQIEY